MFYSSSDFYLKEKGDLGYVLIDELDEWDWCVRNIDTLNRKRKWTYI